MNSSTGLPALTSIITRRGRLSCATISSMECAPRTFVPLASLARKSSTFSDGAVEGHHGEAVVVHVEDQVLAHDGKADQGDVSFRFHCFSFLAAVEISASIESGITSNDQAPPTYCTFQAPRHRHRRQ